MINLRARAAEAPDSGSDEDGAAAPARRTTLDWLFLGSIVTALLPILVATIRAARAGWVPIGDNAYFEVRAQDVLTKHHPWLGTWTSASVNTDTNFNNPGPLLFDLYAIPTKLTDGGIGLAIGAALLNALSIIGIALVARRRGGPWMGIAATATAATLCWTMGSALLYDPWQPHSLLLPFLFGVMLVWSIACGDLKALPWAVFIASLVLQTHMSYAVLIGLLTGWAVVSLALFVRRSARDDPEGWPALRRSTVRAVVIALLVGLLCWSQPLYEQLFGESSGNMARLARNLTASESNIGVGTGTRAAADVLTYPPFWLRPSFAEAFYLNPRTPPGKDALTTINPSVEVGAILLTLLAAIVAAAAFEARRRGDRVASAALGTALVALAAAILTAWNLPQGTLGLPPHQLRWLWPVAAFTTFSLAIYAIRRFDLTERSTQRIAIAFLALTGVVAVLNLPYYSVDQGPTVDTVYAIDVVHEVNEQLGVLEGEGPILIDMNGVRFAEPYTGPVMAELQRRDIPFVVDDEGMVRQLSDTRRLEGDAQALSFHQGDRAFMVPEGSRRVVLVRGLDEDEKEELDRLRSDIAEHFEAEGMRLNEVGEQVISQPSHAMVNHAIESGDEARVVHLGGLAFLVDFDLIDIDPDWRDRIDRYLELQRDWDRKTLGLFLTPVKADGS